MPSSPRISFGDSTLLSPHHGTQLVVRNTFLEFNEGSDLHDCEFIPGRTSRPRANTDVTDARSPTKEAYHMECLLGDANNDGSSVFDMPTAGCRRWSDEVPVAFDDVAVAAKVLTYIDVDAADIAVGVAEAVPSAGARGTACPEVWAGATAAATDTQYAAAFQGLAAWWGCPADATFPGAPSVQHVPLPKLHGPTQASVGMSGAAPEQPQLPAVCVSIDTALNLDPVEPKPQPAAVRVSIDSALNLDPVELKEKTPSRSSRKRAARRRGDSQDPQRVLKSSGRRGSGALPLRAVQTAPGQLDKMGQDSAETPPRSPDKNPKQKRDQQQPSSARQRPKQQLKEPRQPAEESPDDQQQGARRSSRGAEQKAADEPPSPDAATAERSGDGTPSTPRESIPFEQQTTVMLRNIPTEYTQAMLLALLDDHGFRQSFDFVYLPMDFRNGINLGYAFVNLAAHGDAVRLMETFQGYCEWELGDRKSCEVSWAHPHQGLHEHVERYRNSPVMHPCMPDDYKPMLFKAGERAPFPEPTRPIRAPKLRPVREKLLALAEGGMAAPPLMAQGA